MKNVMSKMMIGTMAAVLVLPTTASNNVYAATNKTITYTLTTTSTNGEGTQEFDLPSDFKSAKSVSVDQGNISYKVNGSKITIKANGGTVTSTPYTNPKMYSKEVTKSVYGDGSYAPGGTSSFATTEAYSDSEGYTATALSKSGAAYLSSGVIHSGDTLSVEHKLTSNTNSFPSTYSYSQSGFVGTLNKSGSSYSEPASGYNEDEQRKTVTEQNSANYSDADGFRGTLTKYVFSGHEAGSKTVTGQSSAYYSDSNGYTGTLSKYVASGSPATTHSDSASCTNVKQLKVTPSTKTVLSESPCPASYTSTHTWSENGTTYGGSFTLARGGYVENYDTCRGVTNGNCSQSYTAFYSGSISKPDTQIYAFKGTVSRTDTRVWKYEGTVIKPEYIGLVYQYVQKYAGTVTTKDVDDRVYRQDYKGIAYKSGLDKKDFKTTYKITVTYSNEVTTGCSYDNETPLPTLTSKQLNSKCLKMDNGNGILSEDLYKFKYDFTVTGISNSGR